jgi:transposase
MRLKPSRNSKTARAAQNDLSTDSVVSPRYLPDSIWKTIKGILPPELPSKPGRKRTVDDREILNGILYVLCTNCPWQAMPKEFGPSTTVYGLYAEWKRVGIFEQIWSLCSGLYNGHNIQENALGSDPQ